jgi:hypothetical protein
MSKRLLFITHHRLCDNNGGCNASKGFLHCFAALYDCAVICPRFGGPTAPYIPEGVTIHFIQNKRSNIRKLFDMYRGVISPIYYDVREHLQAHRYDVIVIDHSFSGTGISQYCRQTGAKVITIHHNVERDYLRDNSEEKPLLYRLPYLYYCRKAERDCLRNSDVNLTVTAHDAKVFRSWYPDIHVYPWGIFEHKDTEVPVLEPWKAGHTFVITGSLYFRQSLIPVIDFVKRYWPLVLQTCPDAKLIIAGRNPTAELLNAGAEATGVTIIPNPEKIVHVVHLANYYVCPIYTGSGLKLRLFDGLRLGLPVLCHEVAANGYEKVSESGSIFVYHDEKSFTEALKEMIASDIEPMRIFQSFKDSFSLKAGEMRLSDILKQEQIL